MQGAGGGDADSFPNKNEGRGADGAFAAFIHALSSFGVSCNVNIATGGSKALVDVERQD
jgi:hypothetical protein